MPRRITTKLLITIILGGFTLNAQSASAVTWLLSGNLGYGNIQGAPQPLLDLLGTPFSAVLTYDSSASPTSVTPPHIADYANEGSITLNTLSGSAIAPLQNLQTFILNGIPDNGSNLNGFSGNVGLTGNLTSLTLSPISIDFQFQRTPYGTATGLASFALPNELGLANFDGFNFVRITFAPAGGFTNQISLVGTVSAVTAIPEPETTAMFVAGLAVTGCLVFFRRRGFAQRPPASHAT